MKKIIQQRENIPPSLAERSRFFVKDSYKKTALPKGWNDSQNWLTLDDIPSDKSFGMAITDTDLALIDGDHIIDATTGAVIPEAQAVLDRILQYGDTYTEYSMSETGMHLIIDTGDYAESFPSISNGSDQIILPTMTLSEYEALSDDEKSVVPKFEMFYHVGGRYVALTGNCTEVHEVAKDETAAAMFQECLKMVDECHDATPKGTQGGESKFAVSETDRKRIYDALHYIRPDDRETWIRVGMALFNCGISFKVWDKWSQQSEKYNDGKDEPTAKKWEGFKRNSHNWNIGTILRLAKANGWNDSASSDKPPDQEHKAGKEPPKQFDIKLVPGRELQAANLPPIEYPIVGMIPQGYTVASAPFKYGKSWLALEMCLAVADGVEFLGQQTTKGSTVYFALEDCDQFAQERLNIVLSGREAPEGFYYIMEGVPTLDDGLIDYLNQLYEKVSNLKLVVIDILAKVECQPKRGESAYKCDYRTGGALKKWADDHLTSLIAITHTTKMVHPNDIFMNTTGSSGVSGAADALITIAKENRTDKDALLAITGRRVREKYFKVHLKDGYLWETDGEVDPATMQADQAKQEQEERLEEYRGSDIRKAIIKIADANAKEELSSRDIIDRARESDIHLLNTPKEIGGFICKYQNYLFVEDNIKVYIRKRGTASNVYKFIVWNQVDDEAETPFDHAEG